MLCQAGKQHKWLLQFNFNSLSMDINGLTHVVTGGGGYLQYTWRGVGGSDIFLRLKIYTRGILWIKRPVTIFLVLKSV